MAAWNDFEDLQEYLRYSDEEENMGCFYVLLVPFNYLVRFYIGFFVMLAWLAIGIVCLITVIGFPFAIMAFKCSILMFKPCKDWFEDDIFLDFHEAPVSNIIWCCTVGAVMAVVHAAFGVLFCLSLIWIPTGITYLKSIKYIVMPFGAEIY